MTKKELKELIRECICEELVRTNLKEAASTERVWSCWFDGKEVGTVSAATSEEAEEKMMDKYPEYQYGLYDGCFWVEPEEGNIQEGAITNAVKGLFGKKAPTTAPMTWDQIIDEADKAIHSIMWSTDNHDFDDFEAGWDEGKEYGYSYTSEFIYHTKELNEYFDLEKLCTEYSEKLTNMGAGRFAVKLFCAEDNSSNNPNRSIIGYNIANVNIANETIDENLNEDIDTIDIMDWDTLIDKADEFLYELIKVSGNADYDDGDGYWSGEEGHIWTNRYIYYTATLHDSTRLAKLCNEYSRKLPNVVFYYTEDDFLDDPISEIGYEATNINY